jgi:N-acetylglucosamine malate deacetylase 2
MQPQLLVVAAHPDDETIGASSLLLAAGRAAVVHLTDGAPRDPRLRPGHPDRAAYARLRREEALAALAVAGVRAEDVLSLGAVDQEAIRDVARLAREVAALAGALRPRVVVAHPLEGGHPDHDAAALVARAAVALLARRGAAVPRLVEMTSYHLAEGTLRTGAFLEGTPRGLRLTLGPLAREAKRRMLSRYASQREVLAPFGVDAERFRRAPPASLAARPHPPPLLYEAMGWLTWEAFRGLAREALEALGVAPRAPADSPGGAA